MNRLFLLAATAAASLAVTGNAMSQASNAGVFNPIFETFEVNTLRDVINGDPELTITNEEVIPNTNYTMFVIDYKGIKILMTVLCNENEKCGNAVFYASYGTALSSAGVDFHTSNRGSLFGWHVADNSGGVAFKHALLAKGVTGDAVRSNIKLFTAAYVLAYERLKGSANTVSYTPSDKAGIDAEHLPEVDLTRVDMSAQLLSQFPSDFDVQDFVENPQNIGELRKVLNDFLSSK